MDQNLKNAIATINLTEKLGQIGQKHGLHLDQLGHLEEEVRAVAEGGADPDEFVDKIEERLGLSTETAIAIATDVNLDVFMAIREAMMNGVAPETAAPSTASPMTSTEKEREDLLAEIENPSPIAHPISAVDAKNDAVARDFIGNKLSGMTGATVQKAAAPAASAVQQPAPKPKSYSIDPYREPIA